MRLAARARPLAASVLLACGSGDPHAAPAPAALDQPPAVGAASDEPDETLELDAPRLLHEAGALRVERQGWTFDGEGGVAIRVRLPRDAALDVVPAEAVAPFAALLPDAEAPWVAINGGFYDTNGRPMGLVVDGGKVLRPLGKSGSGVLFAGPGPIRVVHRDAWKDGPREAVQSIDRLVDDGKALVARKDAARRTARSAVAVTEDAVWVVVAFATGSIASETPAGVALESTAYRGLPLWAWADLLVDGVQARQALNLDGAISTQLAVRAEGWRYDVQGEAGTVQAIVLRP